MFCLFFLSFYLFFFFFFFFKHTHHNIAFDLNVTMRWIPIHPKNVYYVGEAMQMACSYNASKPYERIPFAWQFRRQGGPLRWTAFPFRSHVNDQLVPCEGAGCQPTWLSRLHHVVAEGDDKKQFRCVAFNDQRHHGAFTIHVKSEINNATSLHWAY